MFPPEECDKVVVEQAHPNALRVATNQSDAVIGFTAVHLQQGEMNLPLVHPDHSGRGAGRRCSPLHTTRCERRAVAKRSSTHTNRTKERRRFMKRLYTNAAQFANRIFEASTCASQGW